MRSLSTMAVGAAVLTCAAAAWAEPVTLMVPADYPTIQEAIDHAPAGGFTHEVVIAPGTYEECVVVNRAIVLRGEDPESSAVSAKTILRPPAGSSAPVVTFERAGGTAYSFIKGLTITGASAGEGAVCVDDRARVGIYRCIIAGNSCTGVRRKPNSIGATGHCIIRDNEGVGIEFWYCGGQLARSSILNNSDCGVVVNGVAPEPITPTSEARVRVTRNVIHGNGGSGQGGGVRCTNGAEPLILGNTIARNSAGFGAGIASLDSQPTIEDCIIALNAGASAIGCAGGTPTVRHTCVFGVGPLFSGMDDPTGTDGNISADPLFADPDHSDYHLKSQAGRWQRGSWLNDDVTSPCIDAGDPSAGVGDEPAPNGGRLNMGAYGGTDQASKSALTRGPRTPPGRRGGQ